MNPLRAFLRFFSLKPAPLDYQATGGLEAIRHQMARILSNPENQGTLVIEVLNGVGEQFVQFTGGVPGLQMDFPLITTAQRGREQAIRRFAEAHGLRIRATFGSDGSQFIDIDLPPDLSLVTDLTERVFTEVFVLGTDVRLRFSGQNLGVAA